LILIPALARAQTYPWLTSAEGTEAFSARFPPPPGFTALKAGDYAEWLRGLPLEPGRPPVLLFNGKQKLNQRAQLAVVRIDVGKRDLQQCADAVMRLWAEHQWSAGRADGVCLHLTNGSRADWKRWASGERPQVKGNQVSWAPRAKADSSHDSFRRYLDFVFTYAGSASLQQHELEMVDERAVEPGDVLIQGGYPGHAVLVVDVAVGAKGERKMALAQSYMPAQQIHLLDNPSAPGTVWYDVGRWPLETPEWTFAQGTLRRFKRSPCYKPGP
jgi:hypothetical protein